MVVFSGDLLHRSPLNVPLVFGVDEVGVRRNIASLLLVLVERIHGCKSVSHPQSSVESSRQELIFREIAPLLGKLRDWGLQIIISVV